jgi:phosphatidylserine synthase
LEEASYLFLINVLILDILDGLIARLTKTGNLFGKEFDSVVDFAGSSIMISFLVYAYALKINKETALACGFLLVLIGVLREVRSRLEPIVVKGYFIGLPRNAAAVLLITFFNTTIFSVWPWTAVPFIVLLSYFQLSHTPFIGNDKRMLMAIPRMKLYLVLAVVVVSAYAYFRMFWNGICYILSVYLLTPYVLVKKDVWNDIKSQWAKIPR